MSKHEKKTSSLLHYPVLVVFSLFFIGLFALDMVTPDRQLQRAGKHHPEPAPGADPVHRQGAEQLLYRLHQIRQGSGGGA